MEGAEVPGMSYQSDIYFGDQQYYTREELRIRAILRLSTKCVYKKILFHEMILHEMLFHEIQEKHKNKEEDKASKPRLLIIFVGRI